MTFSPTSTRSPFLPTYQYQSEDSAQFLITATQTYSDIANAVNIRQIGTYSTMESLTGQQFTNATTSTRTIYSFRTIYYFGAIAPGATLNIAHGITNVTLYTHIYGTIITNVIDFRPLPYTDEALVTNQVSIKVLGPNIVIINGATAPAITSGIAILEYLKN